MPKISVVIPCHNLGCYLEDSVASVLGQDFADYEIIVVDDGSDDQGTLQLLDGYRRPKTTLIRTANRGVSAARNTGIAAAGGEYILPLDADDRIAPEYLRLAGAVLDRFPEVGIVYSRAGLFGELSGPWALPEFSLPHQLFDNLIFSAALFRKADWAAAGGYDESMRKGWEDWDFWLRLLSLGRKAVQLDEELFAYRIRSGSREQSLGRFGRGRLMLRLVVRHFPLYAANLPALLRILLTRSRRRPGAISLAKQNCR